MFVFRLSAPLGQGTFFFQSLLLRKSLYEVMCWQMVYNWSNGLAEPAECTRVRKGLASRLRRGWYQRQQHCQYPVPLLAYSHLPGSTKSCTSKIAVDPAGQQKHTPRQGGKWSFTQKRPPELPSHWNPEHTSVVQLHWQGKELDRIGL